MSIGSNLLKDEFAKRFEPHGEGYLFRHELGAPGYVVTAAERDLFISQFSRRTAWTMGGLGAALVVFCLASAWFAVANGVEMSSWLITAVALILMIASAGISMWFWGEPRRQLEGRTPVAEGIPKRIAHQRWLRDLSWNQLGLSVGIAVLCVWEGYKRDPTFHGWTRLWLVGAGVLVAIAAVQGFRKWLLERSSR
jgi:hypothetical protein